MRAPRLLVALAWLAAACDAPSTPVTTPPREAAAHHVDPVLCLGCHPDQAARWRGSHHARAMAEASPASVAGAFTGAVIDGVRPGRDGERYVFDVAASAGGATARLHVRYAFGAAPLQQYLVEQPGGRLQAFGLAWDTKRRTWLQLQSADLPWTSRYQTWNTMCAACHSTAVDKRYDDDADRFDTKFADVAVGCQACHGPGSQHMGNPARRLVMRSDVEACAPCHARRTALTATPPAGAALLDHYRPATLQAGLYFPDGQIRDEVFEYGSFAQSAMHENGVRCVDCHDPHAARPEPGDATCLRCHGAAPPPQFPGLAKRARDVASPAHHHHAPDSPGARCVACHMPERTYLQVDRRHDHSFRIPRPDLSAELGTPDVCTQACHAGRDARWSAAVVATWFPGPKPAQVGPLFARAQRGEPVGGELARVATDRARPAIVRATALELALGDPAACAAAGPSARDDASALVRSLAVACAEHLAPATRAGFAAAALHDPVRLVRIEAARVLTGSPAAALDPSDRAAYTAARAELDAADTLDLDRPEGWYNRALLAEAEQRRGDAIADLRRALALDPAYEPARAALSALAPGSLTSP